MKILEKNKVAASAARNEKLLEEKKRADRDLFISKLKENRKFQKYVVEDILLKAANDLNDLSKIPNASFKDLEEVGKIILSTQIAHKKLQSIISELV